MPPETVLAGVSRPPATPFENLPAAVRNRLGRALIDHPGAPGTACCAVYAEFGLAATGVDLRTFRRHARGLRVRACLRRLAALVLPDARALAGFAPDLLTKRLSDGAPFAEVHRQPQQQKTAGPVGGHNQRAGCRRAASRSAHEPTPVYRRLTKATKSVAETAGHDVPPRIRGARSAVIGEKIDSLAQQGRSSELVLARGHGAAHSPPSGEEEPRGQQGERGGLWRHRKGQRARSCPAQISRSWFGESPHQIAQHPGSSGWQNQVRVDVERPVVGRAVNCVIRLRLVEQVNVRNGVAYPDIEIARHPAVEVIGV